jgi:hypothetical protein
VNWNPETRVLRTESYPIEGSKAKKAFVERKIDQETKELIMVTKTLLPKFCLP